MVRVRPASEPASASVRAKAPRARPAQSDGNQYSFWASVPKRKTGIAPSEHAASRVIATL